MAFLVLLTARRPAGFYLRERGVMLLVCLAFVLQFPHVVLAFDVDIATVESGTVLVLGSGAALNSPVVWGGAKVTTTDEEGFFAFRIAALPMSCVEVLEIGGVSHNIVVSGCGPQGEKGEKGDDGVPGMAGPPGIVGYEVVERLCLPATAPFGECRASCPDSKVLLGGSCRGETHVNRDGAYKRDRVWGWSCFGVGADFRVTAHAFCAMIND